MPFYAILNKEISRFASIWVQTIVGPLSTALLYQLIFGHQLSSVSTGIDGVSYSTFLIPGLVIMQVLLNAFGNSSSSLIQSKYSGNIIFILMAPVSQVGMYGAYLIASIVRGFIVGAAVLLGIVWFGQLMFSQVWAILYYAILGAAITGGLGLIAGILCDKFDQLAGFQSFIMVPLIYLSGIFFNIQHFSPFWKMLAMLDPFLYIVDGFRYGFVGEANFSIWYGALFVLVFAIAVNLIGIMLLKRGVKIKN
ncbi:MAG: ABC transporter permease [Burkholderiales bacterium]|nr:ABC transporter permease [Burkholderiales bacterium]